MSDSIILESKYDYQLTKKEIEQLADLYAEIFYHGHHLNKKTKKMVQDSLSKYKIWHWFLIKDSKSKKILAIGSYVYSYEALHNPKYPKLDVSEEFQENVGNIGVSKSHRRKGYAKMIMSEIMKRYSDKDLTLEIKTKNSLGNILFKFYNNLGFKNYGKTSDGLFLRLKSNTNLKDSSSHNEVNKEEDDTLGYPTSNC
jgi:ribosomal protein S18 acetylase RimI-like enzyme